MYADGISKSGIIAQLVSRLNPDSETSPPIHRVNPFLMAFFYGFHKNLENSTGF